MELVLIKHSQLTDLDLEKIIDIKKIHWDYSREEHKEWIDKNLGEADIHALIFNNEELVSYLNLIRTEVRINGVRQSFMGVGNVCSLTKGFGFGKKLMIEIQNYLLKNNLRGILLCKEELVHFYKKHRWELIEPDKIISEQYKNINIMLFNINSVIDKLDYDGRNF
ncbi:GNAT family N-acetyltransferase [Pedobacter sp. SL55]|uniref:GNAT family N-acetyltransferase n=1 Tax=Pedobacter sp. SL55 TaxID=2995161 RepID=UPI00227026CA|nr:GNAT family N-acetyltransferase [Pedobacter sp. SL55]WAC41454.1 GNAT family N-acetyltransferase [Pedobacter sp. SL55]